MISGNLEYLMSSLPNLYFSNSETYQHEVNMIMSQYAFNQQEGQSPVMVLMDEASKFLSRTELDFLKSVNLGSIYKKEFQSSASKVVKEFSQFVWQLKTELSTYRRSKLNEGQQGKSTYDLLADLPSDPLQAEEQLILLQWDKLEELSIGQYSNLSALVLYKLKLEILERFWSFDQEVGFQRFRQSLNFDSYG